MTCCLCNKTAMYKVSRRGYCAEHKDEAVAKKKVRPLQGTFSKGKWGKDSWLGIPKE